MFTNVDSRRTTDIGCRRRWYTNSSPVSPWLTELIIKYIECINNMYPVLMHIILTIMNPSVKNIIRIVSEYDQEIPQSQTADNPVAPRGIAAQPSRDAGKTN